MPIELLWENMSPNQTGVLVGILKESGFEINEAGIVDVRGRQEIPDFPRPNRNYANVGFVRDLKAGIANTEYSFLEEYHHVFRECVERAKSKFNGYKPRMRTLLP